MVNIGPSGAGVAVGGGIAVGEGMGVGVGTGVAATVTAGVGSVVGIGMAVGTGEAVGAGVAVSGGTRVGVGVRTAMTGVFERMGAIVASRVGTMTGVIGVLVTVGGGRVIVSVGEGIWVGPLDNAVAEDELPHANAPSIKRTVTITFTKNLPIRLRKYLE